MLTGSSFSRHTRGGPASKPAVRTTLIVFDTPVSKDNARFMQIAEEFAVQAFIAQLIVKALNMPVFSRAPRLDVQRLDLLGFQPVLHAGGDKLRPIVAAQVLGHSIASDGRFDHGDDIDGSDRLRRINGQALPGVFVEQGEDAKTASIFGLVGHKITAPHLARPLRALPLGRRDP